MTKRPPLEHTLKVWPADFKAIVECLKTGDIRRCDDRDFRVGDVLAYVEFDPGADDFTGRRVRVRCTYVDRMAGPLILYGASRGADEGIPLALLSFGKL